MAASNAYFWTAQGWDGSVAMMEKSRPFALRLPPHHHIRLVSGSAVTSLIVTLQGVMAIKTLVNGTTSTSSGNFSTTISISSIFYPLAFFGLLRLFAALWLTDDYLYYGDIENWRNSPAASSYATASKEPPNVEIRRQTTMALLEPEHDLSSDRFHPTNSWRGIMFRIVYLVPICCLMAICLVYVVPGHGSSEFSLTTLLVVVFYLTFLVASLFLYGFYFLAGRTTSTIIPCATSLWYKIYTAILMALMLVLVIIACLETRITPCGLYTTYPDKPIYDISICSGYPIGTGPLAENLPLEFTAIQAHVPVVNGSAEFLSFNTSSVKNVIVGFKGFCLGNFDDNGAIVNDISLLNGTINVGPSQL